MQTTAFAEGFYELGCSGQKLHTAAAELLWEGDWSTYEELMKVGSMTQCHETQGLC